MNNRNELESARVKASSFSGKLEVIEPGRLDPRRTADTIIELLQSIYSNHALAKNQGQLESDIAWGKVKPWVITRENQPVACAALITNDDDTVELGRAVSLETGTGVGKLAMLLAANAASPGSLVAEVRLADDFLGIPSGEATQRICFGILKLFPHAVLPTFAHGSPLRNEMFAFSSELRILPDSSITASVLNILSGRSLAGTPRKVHLSISNPFRVGIPVDDGLSLEDFQRQSRQAASGCTLIPIEATDQNLATIAWLQQNEFVLAGLDRHTGPNGLPVLLLATLAQGTILAPTKLAGNLPFALERDIEDISNNFQQLTGR